MNLNPEVFREAARLMLDLSSRCYVFGACCAINDALPEGENLYTHAAFLHVMFRPLNTHWEAFYFGKTGFDADEEREHRVLALLLCAEILENP